MSNTSPGRILIATPTLMKSLCTEYVMSLLKTISTLERQGLVADVTTLGGDCFMDKARNSLVETCMKGEYGTLFFIDADQGWEVDGFMRMVYAEPEIVAGIPPKKTDSNPTYGHLYLDTDENGDCYVENGLIRTRGCGTGFLRIRRSALEKMIKAYPQRVKSSDGGPHESIPWLFNDGPVWDDDGKTGTFWGEDLQFCKRWTDMGGTIWVDACQTFLHVGTKAWEGNLLKYLQENAEVRLKDESNVT